jgi:murein DD-endopeptidase MepM/ murein hydrolase activator NlpD
MKPKIVVILLSLVAVWQLGYTQLFPVKNYPRGYFTWPVIATRALAANFGELRPNHYHMGLDCKTEKKQNLQIVAAADGYVAKVKIEPYGFGRAIYINHPNGLTTLYAHLNDFYPELEKYITEQQYKLKSWRVFIDVPANLFPVTKGMFIAYSGNTGGSQGPHLHFEIRDTKTDKVLNPSLFGFPIPDNVPPVVLRLAVYDRCVSTYEQSPRFYTLKKINGGYTTVPALVNINTDKVSFAISAFDSYTGSSNKNGIYETVLYENENPIVGFQLDSIGYDETRYLNAHVDYRLRSGGGPWLQHVAKLPGYNTGFYKTFAGDGVINLEDDSVHQIKIVVKDANDNSATLRFAVQRGAGIMAAKKDSARNNMQKQFHPGFINVFENSNISFYLPENALYDSIRFRYNEVAPAYGYTIHQLHNVGVPVHVNFPVKIRANAIRTDKMVMHRFANNKHDYAKAVFENGWYKASFREFGNFQLIEDTIPPTVTPVGFREGMDCSKQKRIAFVVVDNTEEIKNFTALLDGNWLRFTNDKGKTFAYVFDEYCTPGQHELTIAAQDQAGNVTTRTYHFTR